VKRAASVGTRPIAIIGGHRAGLVSSTWTMQALSQLTAPPRSEDFWCECCERDRLQTTKGEPTVLRHVAEGVLVHESEFVQSNAVVVHGRAGVLLIDPGVHAYKMACLANELSDSG